MSAPALRRASTSGPTFGSGRRITWRTDPVCSRVGTHRSASGPTSRIPRRLHVSGGSPSPAFAAIGSVGAVGASVFGLEVLAVPPQHAGVNVDDEPPARSVARVTAHRPRVGDAGAGPGPVVRLARDGA